jgi:hypothetical protein
MIAPEFSLRAIAVPSSGKMEKNVFNYFFGNSDVFTFTLTGDSTGSRDDFFL